MPDEPAPVGGLVASSGRIAAGANGGRSGATPAATPGTLAPRTLALREAQRRELLEAIRTPIVTTSLAGRITGFNAAAVAMFGSPARLYGRSIVNPFKAYLLERWNVGCHTAIQLFQEIQLRGYTDSYRRVTA